MATVSITKVAEIVKSIAYLGGICVAALTASTTLIMTVLWPMFIDRLATDLDIATKADIAAITERIDEISGENRAFRMVEGHTYVLEPVSVGEKIRMIVTGSRTRKGEACIYREGTPLFVDHRNIPFAGQTIAPVKQLGVNVERVQIELTPPQALEPGRVGVYLAMQFTCPWGIDGALVTVYEETPVTFFALSSPNDGSF